MSNFQKAVGVCLVGAGVYGAYRLAQVKQEKQIIKKNKNSFDYQLSKWYIPLTVPTFYELHPNLYKKYDLVAAALEKAGIQFWPIAGTALGVGRFNGIIPWDDDIDLGIWEHNLEEVIGILNQNTETAMVKEKDGLWKAGGVIDIFTMSTIAPGKCAYSSEEIRNQFPKEWFSVETTDGGGNDELQTWKKVPFGPTKQGIWWSNGMESYLTRSFGKNWKTLCYVKVPHTFSWFDRFLYFTNRSVEKKFTLTKKVVI